ncbi:MAG TPA: hypothetical protein DEP84_01190 [Chloroflexi bacterium]|nr:hypothetical protein [Chloroflexota bacterium]
MSASLILRAGGSTWPVSLNESATAAELCAGLRFAYGGPLLTWGGMRYFSIGWKWGVEQPVREMQLGDLTYWDVGSSLCLFLGPTPLDHHHHHHHAPPFTAPSVVSLVGHVGGDLQALAALRPSAHVQLLAAPAPDAASRPA